MNYPLYLRINALEKSSYYLNLYARVTDLSKEEILYCWNTSRKDFIGENNIDPKYAQICEAYFLLSPSFPQEEKDKIIHILTGMITIETIYSCNPDLIEGLINKHHHFLEVRGTLEPLLAVLITLENGSEDFDLLIDLLWVQLSQLDITEEDLHFLLCMEWYCDELRKALQ